MKLSKEVFEKVKEYQELKSKAKSLKSEIKELIEKEYLEKPDLSLELETLSFLSPIQQREKGKKKQEHMFTKFQKDMDVSVNTGMLTKSLFR